MKKLKKNEVLNKKSLFLLNKSSNEKYNETTTFLSYINDNLGKTKKINYFRNTSFLKHSKLQSNLLKFEHASYGRNKNKKISNLKDTNNFLKIPRIDINNNSTDINKKNYRLLKGIFPNLSELNLYSNFPLFLFGNEEKKYNSRFLLKKYDKYNNKKEIKKKIYNYYYKKSKQNDSDNNKEDKIKSYEKNIKDPFIRNLKFKQNERDFSNLSKKYIKFYLQRNLPIKVNKLNLLNNKYSEFKKESNLSRNTSIDIFENKEINKYIKNNKIVPNMHNKNTNNYKSVKIKKNISFVKIINNNFLNYNSDKEDLNNSFLHNDNPIQSILSRNKKKSFKEKNKIYEDKETDTNEEN